MFDFSEKTKHKKTRNTLTQKVSYVISYSISSDVLILFVIDYILIPLKGEELIVICTIHVATSGLKFTGPVCVAHRVGDRITTNNLISVVVKGFGFFFYITFGSWTIVILLFRFFYFCLLNL